MKKKKARELILQRQDKVQELYYIQRLSIRKIAKLLDYNPHTIWRDIQVIREQYIKQINELDLREIMRRRYINYQNIINKMWKQYNQEPTPIRKANILTKIDDIDSRFIKDLQELHHIVKPTERHEITERKEELIAKFDFIIEHGHKSKDTKDKLLQESKLRTTTKTK